MIGTRTVVVGRWWCVGCAWLLSACAASGLPEGEGKGVVAFDRTQPAGTVPIERPEWTVGDRFAYLRAGLARLPMHVTEKTPAGYVLEDERDGQRSSWTLDLAEIGEETPGEATAQRVQSPADVLLHWPLWPGKRWSCHFLRKAPGEQPLPLLALYHCDGEERITVPAGTFNCLRIWRRVRVAAPGEYLERVSLLWYAPEVGFFARRLENGTLVELEAFHRQ